MKGKSFLNGVLMFKGVVSAVMVVILLFGMATASASISMYGVGDGMVSYDAVTDIYQHNGVTGDTVRISDLFGWGLMELAYTNNVNDNGISGYIGADLYNGQLLVKDAGLVMGEGNINQTEEAPCVFEETEDEYCEYCTYMESDSTVVLSGQGTTLSQMALTPVYPSGGIDHTTTMRGNGTFSAESAYDGYLDINSTESSISLMADRFEMRGSNLSVSRHVRFVSEHTV